MKQVLVTLFLILVALPCRAQWQDAGFEGPQILAFGTHDTSFFLSALPQNDIDSLIWRRNADGGWICHAIGIGLERTQGNITSFTSLGKYFFAGQSFLNGENALIYRSSDQGKSWAQNDSIGSPAVSNGRYLFAIDAKGISWSSDSGNTWVSTGNGLSPISFGTNGAFIVASTTQNLYRSVDNGLSWTQASSPLSNIRTFTLIGTTFYGTNGTQLIESTDSGGSWSLVNTNFNVAYLASDSVHLFAGGSSGVYYFDPQSGNWIYESGDTSVLDNRGIVALGVFDTLLFADFASSPHQNYQLFMRSIPEMTQKSGVAQPPQIGDTIEVDPNPAATELSIFAGQHSILRVQLLNILGEAVLDAHGADAARLNLSKLPAGTYFLQIQTTSGVALRKITKE